MASTAGGTLGLVNDLSVKLQKQRKQLNTLVKEVKSAQAAELRWYDYAGIIVCNNLLVVLLGFTLGSLLLGVGPSDGSFHAGQITAVQLTVSRPAGDQEVMVQSTQSNSTIALMSPTESSLVIAGSADDPQSPQFKWATANSEHLTLTQGAQATPDLAIRPLIPGLNNVTDVCFSPGGGQGTVVVSNNLELTGTTIATRNGSLTVQPALNANIEVRPTADGRVDVRAPVVLEGRLKVSLGTDIIQFDGNPRTNTVEMGVDGESQLTIHGTANLSSSCAESQISSGVDSRSVRPCHIINGGNLNILKGNMMLGKANINTEGQLSVAGDVNFGTSVNDTLEIQGTLAVTNGTMDNVAMDPLTGSVESMGNLYVDQMADLRSSVTMGSKLSDTVDIKAQLTSLHHLNASGSAALGSLDSHDVLLFGNLTVVANGSAEFLPILSVDGIVGDVFSDCDLHVTRSVHLDGSVAIGMSGDTINAANGSQMLTVSKSVDASFQGSVHLNQTLQVDGDAHLSDTFGDECVLRGPLAVGEHAEDFTVDHSTGNVYIQGVATVEKSGMFLSNVSMGQGKRHLTVVGGDTRMRSTMHSHSSFSVGDGMTIDGELNVGESLLVTHDHQAIGDVYLGNDAGQRTTVHGRLVVKTPAEAGVLDIEPSGGDITVDGRLTVQGETVLDETTTITASATVNGAAMLEAALRVDNSVVVAKDGHVAGRIAVNREMAVAANFTVDGPASLGSGPQNDVGIYGHLSVQADGNDQPLLAISPLPSGVHISDTLLVQSNVRFDDKLDLGHPLHGPITVLAATLVNAPTDALGDVQVNGDLQVRDHATMDAAVIVHSDTILGHRDRSTSNVITVAGDLVLMDADETRVHISDASGNLELWSDLQVQGNLELGEEGTINTPRFVAGSLAVKEIRERTTDEGVTVEGVVFVDGGIKMARVHEMREELPTKGVTLEGANCKAGALVLSAGSGTNDIDALTLTNQNHALSMANISTRLAWKQYFHDSRAGTEIDSEQVYHSAADAASVTVTAVGDWTDEPLTQNAKISFETTWKGVVEERARILPEGHFVVGSDVNEATAEGRVVLDSAKGDLTMAGNLYVGAGMYSCSVPSAPAPGGGSCNVCSACCMNFLEQIDCDDCVVKQCTNTYGTRSLDIVSEAEQSSLVLKSGGDGSTTITLTSGATTESNSPASFSLINTAEVGTIQTQPSLRLVDSQADHHLDLLVLSARPVGLANVGDLYVAGSMIVGELNTTETQTLKQSVGLSGGPATLTAQSMGSFDASVVVTSGPNQRAYLKLQDPADGGQGSGFWIFNDGTKGMLPDNPDEVPEVVDLWTVASSDDPGFPTMRISNDITASLLSLYDQGDSGSLQLNGDFEVGHLDSIDARMLRVQSSTESAMVNVIGGAGADALVSIAAGENQRAVVLLEDPDGKYFSIGPHTESPTMMFGWGTDAESEHALVNITRTPQSDGMMHVSGSGIIGALDMQVPCSLGVVSGAKAELSITAGDGEFGASATLTSGPDQSASLVLSVQSAADAVGTPEELYALELTNAGSAETPMFQLVHQETELLTLKDEGERGDLAVSGNLILGDRSSDASRSLAIESQARADLIVVSGIASDSVLQVMSGVGQDAQFRLEDTTEGNAATFIFKNSGAANALQVVDAADSLMLEVHDKGEVGDLKATGDAVFGDADTSDARALTITAGTQAKLDVMAGLNSDARVSLLSGTGNTAGVELRSSNKTGFRVYTGGTDVPSGITSALRIAVPAATGVSSSQPFDELRDIVSVIDRGPAGDLHCSGNVVVGAIHGEESYTGEKWLKIESNSRSNLAVHSGDFEDASIELLSGPRQNSALRLEQLNGAVFKIGLNHASLQSPSLEITDGDAHIMVVTDRGATGDLLITGNGAFGSAPDSLGTVLDNKLQVVGSYATLDVVAGLVDTATLSLSSGADSTAAIRLATHDTSFYELRNVGNGAKRMEIHTQDANIMQLRNLGDRSQLAFVGDVDIGSTNGTIDTTLEIASRDGQARVGIQAGHASNGILELQSGTNKMAAMSLISKSSDVSGSDVEFNLVLDGGRAGLPKLEWKDGSTSVMTVTDTGIAGDVHAVAIACAQYSTTGDTSLGDSTEDSITINAHIANTELHFDGDRDGVTLMLRFEDPATSSVVTFPDESGTVLTTASSFSNLRAVGGLSSGAIAEGFGRISTASDIRTIGDASSITAAGTVTSHSNFVANGNIVIGDDAADSVSFRGVVQESFRFFAEKGIKFHDETGAPSGKTTWLKAAFDSTSQLGERQIMLPDVPMGGALHVVSNIGDPAQVSNVNQVSMDATAGKIMSPPNLVLLPMDDVTFHLVNRRVKPDSVVIATVADDQNVGLSNGAWIKVTAVKVNTNGGGCAIVVHNVHPTVSGQVGFSINFVVFNAS